MSKKLIKIYLTVNPDQQLSRKILLLPLIEGIRCNTGAPISKIKSQLLKEFQIDIYPIKAWVDLKCRELRIVKDAVIPKDYLEINHKIDVKTPTALYYNEGKNFIVIDKVIDGNKIVIKPPKNFTGKELIKFGKGASINIPDNSLHVHEYMTPNDIEYVEAAKQIGLHNYLLSFVESKDDIKQLMDLDPKATILAKIESKKGLEFVKSDYELFKDKVRLLAARADLYIELDRPHDILSALKLIIKKDPTAIGASRILESFLELQNVPKCADICDIGYLLELGYKTFLLGDDLCQNENALSAALGLFSALNV